MFFPTFSDGVISRLPKETIFTVEYLTSQILVNAEPKFLEEALANGNLIEGLLQELEFFGQIRKDDLPDIREYLTKQESSLQNVAKLMMKESDNPDLRRHFLSPDPLGTS
jgi:ribosomal protein S19E (S16A)